MIAGRIVDLRPVEPSDAALLHELAGDPAVAQAVVGWSMPSGLAERADHLVEHIDDASTRRLVIVERDGGRDVGVTGLWDIDHRDDAATTGIRLRHDAWGRGIGTDAVMTLMAWAFHDVGLHRLETTILDFNAASLALYVDRCGWTVEGREREAVLRGGRRCDRYRVGMLRPDFDGLPDAADYVARIVRMDVTPTASRPVEIGSPPETRSP